MFRNGSAIGYSAMMMVTHVDDLKVETLNWITIVI